MRIIWLFSITIVTILCIRTIPVYSQCLEDQRSLLLQLQNSLKFNPAISVKLVNWTPSKDCCDWKGVTCDQAGHVTGLDLNSEFISGGIDQSSSLFSLQFLESLNLANNSFNRKQIPSSFGNLISLKYLNLSNAGFGGQIPIALSCLKRLVTLDLSALFFPDPYLPGTAGLQLENPNLLTLIQNLTGLRNLYLDGINISAQGSEWCRAISSSLPNLQVLSMSNCYLSGPIDSSLLKLQSLSEIHLGSNDLSVPVPEFFANFTNLTALRLSYANLYGMFPEKIFQVPTLQTLDLSENIKLQGVLPLTPDEDGDLDFEPGIYVSVAVGFVVGLGSFIGALALCKRWRQWYYKHVDQVLERTFHLEERRRRRNRRKRAYRDPIRRL
ncbi:Receptor-like protein 7 [Camellia lanceoleosa]|uniref:Receptor-like protein 7 n=1 Tax=Camellia lanceoleosa TaxID=1840588 RepID=A0ACC0INL6_9ERIC|nr:Receptor-like protein 7 [Camellia lanceoleosa]